MDILIKTLQVILSLSLLVLVHELGHFMWARIFHIRVDKFYIFFDIGGKALWKHKFGDTEYGIGWLPLGGYCKIAGMVDESMDMESLKKEPQPWEFRSHPAWQRLLVMAGGVLNNFILAIVIYMCIMGIWGESHVGVKGSHIYATPLAEEMGFRTGDEILRMDDYVPDDFGMLQADLVRRDVSMVQVLRDADTVDIYIDKNLVPAALNAPLFDLALPFVVDSVDVTRQNADAGLEKGDRFTAFDSTQVRYMQDARKVLSSLAGRTVSATVERGTAMLTLPVKVDTSGMLGVYIRMPEVVHRDYSFAEAIPAGWSLTFKTMGGYLKDLKMLATPSTGAYKSVGSFIAIGQVFPSAWDWYQFMYILALLSIMLGVMNLIPIPGLDGGHILFTLYEMVTGRKPSDKFLAVMQMIGMVLLVALMLLAFGNDIGRIIR